jgi:hypothetical protein
MPEAKKAKPSATSRDDLLSRLKTARPDDVIRITRYPDGTEIIEIFPPRRGEREKSEKPVPVRKPIVPKYRFEDQEKGGEAPDWLKEAEEKKKPKPPRMK